MNILDKIIQSRQEAASKLIYMGYMDNRSGISRFQKEHNLPLTGMLDPITIYMINNTTY